MDATKGLGPTAKSDDLLDGTLFTDLLRSEAERKLRLACIKNGIPHGTFEPGHFHPSQVLKMVEWEFLGEQERENAEGLDIASGCPGNAGGLPVLRPFSRAEAAMLQQAGIIGAADMDQPQRLADDLEAEGDATPLRTSEGAGGTGAPSKALHTAAPTPAQDAGKPISSRAMADYNANVAIEAAVEAQLERLGEEFPKTTKWLRACVGTAQSMNRRSIVAISSFGSYLEAQRKGVVIMRKSTDLSVHRAEGGAPWLTSFQADLRDGVFDKVLSAALASGKIHLPQSAWQILYGGFGQASAAMALLAIKFTPVVTRHGKELVEGIRSQRFVGHDGHIDAGTPLRYIERAMANAARDSVPINYDKIVRVLLSRLASAASAKVLTGSPAAWDSLLSMALTLTQSVGTGVFGEDHSDELLEGMNLVADAHDVQAGIVSAELRADESAAEESVSMVIRGTAQANDYTDAHLSALADDQNDEPSAFVGLLGASVPMTSCTFCAQPIKVNCCICHHCGRFKPGWECPLCVLPCGPDFDVCPRWKWFGCPGTKDQGRPLNLEVGSRHHQNGQRVLARIKTELAEKDTRANGRNGGYQGGRPGRGGGGGQAGGPRRSGGGGYSGGGGRPGAGF